MGDISRHRDIFLNTRDAIPTDLLARCGLTVADLTFLELGNYFTDVSQFRDPVFYLFAKRDVWNKRILPRVDENVIVAALKTLTSVAAVAGGGLLASSDGWKRHLAPAAFAYPAALGILGSRLNDLIADWKDADEWLDRLLGKPIEDLDGDGERTSAEYGEVGQFFEHFVAGITQMLFADDVGHRAGGGWGSIDRIPSAAVADVFRTSFTQYYPHEHVDQPPYVWDASERPDRPEVYGPGPRRLEGEAGIMNVVHDHYLGYLAEGLASLEHRGRALIAGDLAGRRAWLVDLGKLLHGVEDWYFHSNIVEMLRFHARKPVRSDAAGDEAAMQRFVEEELTADPQYQAAAPALQVQMKRYLYRRMRSPIYGRGTRVQSGGVASTTASHLDWDHVYPAFPSTLDTAHTLLGALETIEQKLKPGTGGLPLSEFPWARCLFERFRSAGQPWRTLVDERARARGFTLPAVGTPLAVPSHAGPELELVILDVFRELIPLVPTLLSVRERQRLVTNVAPMDMPLDTPPRSPPGVTPGTKELDDQVARHARALQPREDATGVVENDYARAARFLADCGDLNPAGRDALVAAFDVDARSERSATDDFPGAGGFLIQFAVKLQTEIDAAEARTEALNSGEPFASVATDNGSANEIIGSHSLIAKDTKDSSPFFDDARVLACVASQAVLHLLLDEVSAPAEDRLHWLKILRHFVRFPPAAPGWERRALALFAASQATPRAIPRFADLPELAALRKLRMPAAAAEALATRGTAAKLRKRYRDLERPLTRYRYPWP